MAKDSGTFRPPNDNKKTTVKMAKNSFNYPLPSAKKGGKKSKKGGSCCGM